MSWLNPNWSSPIFAGSATICLMLVVLLVVFGFIFHETSVKIFKLAAGVIWRISILPLGVAVPAVGWWVILVGGETTGWWKADPMPPAVDFDSFCLWTAVGLISYGLVGRTVKAVGRAVREAWKDAHPEHPPAERPRDGGGGGPMNPNSVYFRALEARLRAVETKVEAHTRSLNARSRNQSKVKQRLDELEARLSLLKGDAPNDGEEV